MRAERALALLQARCMIAVIGMTEVLLARMVSGRAWRSMSANSFCFSGKSSDIASTT